MAGTERFDDSIGRWLEDTAPNRIPQRVLEATFERTRRTGQEPAWRQVLGRIEMPAMSSSLARLGAATVAVAAIAVVALAVLRPGPSVGPPTTASPGPASPSVAASHAVAAPPLTQRFDSALNAISIDYPAGWEARPASQAWSREALDFDAPGVDVIFDPALRDVLYIALASEPIDGNSAGAWDERCCEPVIQGPDVCEPGGGVGAGIYQVDGIEGWAATKGCEGGGDRRSVTVVTTTRGYVIRLYVRNVSLTGVYDSEWFDEVLRTVDLRSGTP